MAEEGKPVSNVTLPPGVEFDIDYDFQADVLYCSFGPPQDAVGEETETEGVVVRRNPETNAIVGITVVDFSKRFKQEPRNTVSVTLDGPVAATVA